MFWKIRGGKLSCAKTLLMGIVNVTPDSFSDGGQFIEPERAAAHALKLIEEGADILDLGAESSRPGADPVSTEEELKRLLPVLDRLSGRVSVPLSIDTVKPEVARACLERGAHIINDVSGLKESGPGILAAVREFEAGLVIMHRRGNAKTMQDLAIYQDVVKEVFQELEFSVDMALASGVCRDQIAVDPALGFSKTAEQNLEIMRQLEKFREMRLPVVLGPSRKSFIGKITGRDSGDRTAGTVAACTTAASKGNFILRVHDVAAVRDAVKIVEAIEKEIKK